MEGLWDHLADIQQQLEDKEQAIAILQETVKVWSCWTSLAAWTIWAARQGCRGTRLPQFQTPWLSFCRAGTDPVKGIRGVQGPDQREATSLGLFRKQFMEHLNPSLRQKRYGGSLMHSSPALLVCPHHTQVQPQGYRMAVWTKAHLRKQVLGEHLKST